MLRKLFELFITPPKAIKLHEALKKCLANQLGQQLLKEGWEEVPFKERHPFSTAEYRKIINDIAIFIDIQRDKYWNNKSGIFTVNLKVLNIAFEKFYNRFEVNEINMLSNYWSIMIRLSSLINGRNKWYKVTQRSNINKIASTCVNEIMTFGKPWLDKMRNENDFIDFLKADQISTAIAFLAYKNRMTEAMSEYAKIKDKIPSNSFIHMKIREWELRN